MKLPSAITSKLGQRALQLKVASPQLMFVGGAVAGAAGVVLACRSTLRLSDTLAGFEELKAKSDMALENRVVIGGVEYDEKTHSKDQVVIRVKTLLAITKLYAPAAGLMVLSASLLTGSHVTLTRRNAATAAAYASIDQAFSQYRERVRDQLGADVDRDLRYGTQTVTETTEGEDGKKKVVKHTRVADGAPSMYAKFFDESCLPHQRNPEYNRIFLQAQQGFFNQMLQTQGYVFLNDVYQALGLPKTKAGQVVGWMLGKGDNFVDFGIFDNVANPAVRDFVNGHEYSILLDFNVDGLIIDSALKD